MTEKQNGHRSLHVIGARGSQDPPRALAQVENLEPLTERTRPMNRYLDQDGTLLQEHAPGQIRAVREDGTLAARSVPLRRWADICGPLVELPPGREDDYRI